LIRKAQSRERKITAYTEEVEIRGIASDKDSPERLVLKAEQNEIVQEAINGLPPKQREVVTLYYMQHLKYREIAEVLNCAEGTVASRLNKALKNLKAKLSKYYL